MKKKDNTKAILAMINKNLDDFHWGYLQEILSVLRGPDDVKYFDSKLKNLTVGRIRAITLPNYAGDLTPKRLTKKQMVERDNLLKEGSTHFRSHYETAVIGIRMIYDYDLETEKPWVKA